MSATQDTGQQAALNGAPAREVNTAAASNAAGTYGDFGGRVLTQADPFAPPGHGRFEEHLAAMRSGEQQVLDGPYVEGIALRHGLFYGPGPAGDALVDGLRRRRLPVVSGGGVQPRGISTTTRRRSPRWNAAPPARPITSPMTSR